MTDIRLIINGYEADLTEAPEILFTYNVDDLTNPTVVKNSYAKSLTLKGTANNLDLFGNIWHLERVQSYYNFNPSKKAPFTITVNGEIYQTGYCKLTEVHTNGNDIEFVLDLFGGLGSFFYSLMYSNSDDPGEAEKRKLSDLHFHYWDSSTPSSQELDFTINRQFVSSAWSQIETNDRDSIFHTINFAPAYNGVPEDFDADKVLLYTDTLDRSYKPGYRPNRNKQSGITTTQYSDGVNYSTYQGFVLAELPVEKTEDEMRDYRSWLQRPVLRVKDVIEAICAPENNNGYTVDLDSDFFTSDNPYWEKSYVTLPKLSAMDYIASSQDSQSYTALTNTMTRMPLREYYKQQNWISIYPTPSSGDSYNLTLDCDMLLKLSSSGSFTTAETINFCANSENTMTYYAGAIELQLVAYNSAGRAVAGSPCLHLTSPYGHRRSGRDSTVAIIPKPSDFDFTPEWGNTFMEVNSAYFDYDGSNWKLNTPISLTVKGVPAGATVKLVATKVYRSGNTRDEDSVNVFQPYYDGGRISFYKGQMENFEYANLKANITRSSGESIRSGSKFTKANLLNTDYTPADFLLSYCKLFGLFFLKDPVEDKISILTRKNFFQRDEVIDLSADIDRGQTLQMKPLVFNAKWYNWGLEGEESVFSKTYYDNYGSYYGSQRVNTGYNFDGNEVKVFTDNIFKSAVECLERDDDYAYYGNDKAMRPWMTNGFTYNLYNAGDTEDTVEIKFPSTTRKGFESYRPELADYDLFTKVQLHGEDGDPNDGSGVLLFYDGETELKSSTNDSLYYYLSDDTAIMAELNEGTPCWLYTPTGNDDNGTPIVTTLTSLPHFSRYLINKESGVITRSWDFGEPQQLFIPWAKTSPDSTIYNNFWKTYIRDLYDIDTRVLTAYVDFKGRPTHEFLRKFFWFDNCYWRITKITDYDVAKPETSMVDFVKVADLSDYSSDTPDGRYRISLSFSSGSTTTATTVPNSGGTVRVYVSVSDGAGKWYVGDSVVDYSVPTQGAGSGYFDVSFPANTGQSDNVYISCISDYDDWSNAILVTRGETVLRAEFQPPWTHRDIYLSGETLVPLTIYSTYPVTIEKDRTYVTLSTSAITEPDPLGKTIYAEWSESDSLAPRSVKFTITDSVGNKIDVWKWQDGIAYDGNTPSSGATRIQYNYTGGTKSVSFVSGAGITSPDWVDIVDEEDGNYTIAARANGGAVRLGTATFSVDDTTYFVDVEQLSAPDASYLDIERWGGTGDVGPDGGVIKLRIEAPSAWTLTSDSAWCVLNTSAGTGNTRSITATLDRNDGVWRQATLSLSDGLDTVTYTIAQDTASGSGTGGIVPGRFIFPASGGSQTASIILAGNWTVFAAPAWVTTDVNSGTGLSTLTLTAASTTDPRNGSLVIESGGITYTADVMQYGIVRYASTTPDPVAAPASGGVVSFTLNSNSDWLISSNPDLTFSTLSGSGDTSISVTVPANSSTQSKTYTSNVYYNDSLIGTITVNQEGAPESGTTDISTISAPSTGDTVTGTVTTNTTWTATTSDAWITVMPSSGNEGNTTVIVTTMENTSLTGRTGYVYIKDENNNTLATITVNQDPAPEYINVVPNSLVFDADGGTATFTITSNTNWTIQ